MSEQKSSFYIGESKDGYFLFSKKLKTRQDAEALQTKIEFKLNKSVFVKCQIKECFPEHKYTEKDGVFYCSNLPIGEVNWD